jgi:hypothetical protein
VEACARLEDLPVAEVDGSAIFGITAGIGILHRGIDNGTGIEDGDGGETDVDEKAMKFPGIAHKAIRIALFGVVEDIGGHKLIPGGRVCEIGLVGGHSGKNAGVTDHVEFGGEISGDDAGRRSRVGHDGLGVVLKDNGAHDGIGGRNYTIVVHDATDELIETCGKLIVSRALIDHNIGSIADELRETRTGTA